MSKLNPVQVFPQARPVVAEVECKPEEMPPADTSFFLHLAGMPKMVTEKLTPIPLSAPRVGCVRAAVSEAEAQRLWEDLAKLEFVTSAGNIDKVPFGYPADGCYARAHLMAQRLANKGIAVRKVFAQGQLKVESAYGGDAPADKPGQVNWGWHVAPTIRVYDKSGAVRSLVMDPSITSGPVTPEAWNHIMGGRSTITHANANAYYPEEISPSPESAAQKQSAMLESISIYAILAPAHEMAAQVRKILSEKQTGKCDVRQERARNLIASWPTGMQDFFKREYPLLAKLSGCPS